MNLRTFLTISILLSILSPMAAGQSQQVEMLLTCDAWAIESVWTNHTALRMGLEMRHDAGVGLKVPISVLIDRTGGGEALLDMAVKLVCLPWSSGPYVSLSLMQACIFVGPYVPQQQVHYVSEIELGYSWEFRPGWFVQPSILYRDPSNGFPESHAYMQGLLPAYRKFQFCLEFGWAFLRFSPEKEAD